MLLVSYAYHSHMLQNLFHFDRVNFGFPASRRKVKSEREKSELFVHVRAHSHSESGATDAWPNAVK